MRRFVDDSTKIFLDRYRAIVFNHILFWIRVLFTTHTHTIGETRYIQPECY